MEINGKSWVLDDRQSGDCSGTSDQDKKGFRSHVRNTV